MIDTETMSKTFSKQLSFLAHTTLHTHFHPGIFGEREREREREREKDTYTHFEWYSIVGYPHVRYIYIKQCGCTKERERERHIHTL